MNDEIKEIYLSNSEWTKTHDNIGGVMCNFIFKDNMSYEEYEKLLKSGYFVLCNKDYITNLQQDYERANQYIDFYKDLVNKQAKRNSRQRLANQKQQELILKLQQENKTLQENNQNMQEEMARVWEENEELRKNQRFHKKFGDDYIFCVEGDKETYKDMIFMYQERIEKAITILNNIYMLDNVTITNNACEEIDKAINILQGENNGN